MKRKIIAVLTSCALIMGLSVTAFAEDVESPEEQTLEVELIVTEVPQNNLETTEEEVPDPDVIEDEVLKSDPIEEENVLKSDTIEEELAPAMDTSTPPALLADEPVPAGYTSDEHELSAWKQSYEGYNIINKVNGKWQETTYSSGGYRTTVRINDEYINLVAPIGVENDCGYGLFITITPKFSEDGKYISPVYTIRNGGEEDIIFDIATSADIQIGNNDYAPIETFEDGKGFKMTDPETNVQFNFFGRGVEGVTPVDAFWIGRYGQLRSPLIFTQTELTELTGYDSAMAFSWHGINLSPLASIEKMVLLGNGEIGSEEEVLKPEPEIEEPKKEEPIVVPKEEVVEEPVKVVKAEEEVVEEPKPEPEPVTTVVKTSSVIPKTGDSSEWSLQFAIFMAALIGAIVIQYRRSKR